MSDNNDAELLKLLERVKPLNARQVQNIAALALAVLERDTALKTVFDGDDAAFFAGLLSGASVVNDVADLVGDILDLDGKQLETLQGAPLPDFLSFVALVAERVTAVNEPVFRDQLMPLVNKIGESGAVQKLTGASAKAKRKR